MKIYARDINKRVRIIESGGTRHQTLSIINNQRLAVEWVYHNTQLRVRRPVLGMV